MSGSNSMKELSERYSAAVSTADEKALRALFAPGAIVWHNHDGIAVPFEDSATSFTRWLAQFDRYAYRLDRLMESTDGFVLQTTIGGDWRSQGSSETVPFEGHYCLVFSVEDGAVTRLDEYTDPQTLALS